MTNILPIIHLFFFAVQQFDYLVLDLNQELCQLGPAFLIKAEYQYPCLQIEKSILRTCVLHPKGNCLKTDWRVLPQTLGRFHNNKPKEEEAATCNRVQSLKSAIHEHKDACACVCVSVWWAIQQWQWNILILTVESQSLASREEKEKTQVITSTRECGRSTKRHSSWKHYDRWRRKKEKRKGGKTSWVSSVSWICLWETREAEYDSTCRHQNICLKSQQETRERRERQ